MANLADPLRAPLELPCGKTLGTRIIKGATTEYSADEYGCANEKHVRLYSAWAANDFGIQIVGQFMVDHRYMEAATNVVIDDKSPHTMAPAHLDTLKRVASARNGGSSPDNQLMVVQLSHPGRQSRPICSTESIGVSPDKPVLLFGAAVAPLRKEALSVKEIDETIHKYVHAATTLQACGFDGVQIHCGHGYLGHQFLSPITNVRTDAYGGSVEKRAKWICDLCDAMRAACGPKFVIGVRISAQDFEPGGNTAKDTAKVCAMLDARKVDFIEVSGGSSENLVPLCGTYMSRDYRPRLWNYVKYCLVFLAFCTALLVPLALGFLALAFYLHLNPGVPPEGWFLADALEIKRLAKPKHTKIGTVGGFYTRHAMEDALKKGVDFVSVCSTIVYDPHAVKKLLERQTEKMFHPMHNDGVLKLGIPLKKRLMNSFIPAWYTFKIPAQSTGWTSTFYIERIAITWLWLEGTCIQRLAAGYTGKPPLPGNGAPSMIAGAGAKLAQDKKDLEAAKPYWKIDGHGHSNGCFMHEREDILQDGKG